MERISLCRRATVIVSIWTPCSSQPAAEAHNTPQPGPCAQGSALQQCGHMSGSAAPWRRLRGTWCRGLHSVAGQAKGLAVLHLGDIRKQALCSNPCVVSQGIARAAACTSPQIRHSARDCALQQDSSAIPASHPASWWWRTGRSARSRLSSQVAAKAQWSP